MSAFRTGYSRYVLAVLLLGYVLNSFDRSILSLLLEPIRTEFKASDTQLGLAARYCGQTSLRAPRRD